MTKQEIFEFLRDNLSLSLDEDYGSDYGRFYRHFEIRLSLTNPETGKDETISYQSFSIDLE